MSQIGAVNQVLLLLRERLERSGKQRPREADRTERAGTPQQRIEGLAAIEGLPPRDFRRAVVRSLLSERLGEALVADPAFDAVTGEVLRILEDSDDGTALLDAVVADLRSG